jgi:hypothetical protein
MIFGVLTAVRITIMLFWVVTPCRLVGRYESFGETYFLHLNGLRSEHGDMEMKTVAIFLHRSNQS